MLGKTPENCFQGFLFGRRLHDKKQFWRKSKALNLLQKTIHE
jgi:hypothetical protein